MDVEAALWQPDGAAEEGCSITGVVGKPPWELCHQAPSPTTCLHPAARQVGRSVATCARSLNVQPACVCVWHQRMWQGLHCRLATAAMWCRYRYSPACPPVPRPAGCGTREWRGTALAVLLRHPAQLASPELTPTCHPARISSQQGQKVKKGSGRFWPLVTLQP